MNWMLGCYISWKFRIIRHLVHTTTAILASTRNPKSYIQDPSWNGSSCGVNASNQILCTVERMLQGKIVGTGDNSRLLTMEANDKTSLPTTTNKVNKVLLKPKADIFIGSSLLYVVRLPIVSRYTNLTLLVNASGIFLKIQSGSVVLQYTRQPHRWLRKKNPWRFLLFWRCYTERKVRRV